MQLSFMYSYGLPVNSFSVRVRGRLPCVALGIALSLSAWTRVSAEDVDSSTEWNPRFNHFTPVQYSLAIAGMGTMFLAGTMPVTSDVNWRSEILFDHGAKSLFAASTESGRRRASDVSDYIAFGLAAYPFAIDALLVAGGVHQNYEVAYQLALIGAQTMMVTNLVTGLTKRLVGRARPDAGLCVAGNELACATENESFISGHTSAAFAGAGLICANQQNLRLYGSDTAGAIACGVGLAGATAVGTLRMVANRHHLSDVLAGAAVGLAAGYLLPNLTNFDFGANGRSHGTLTLMAGDGTAGLQYLSAF